MTTIMNATYLRTAEIPLGNLEPFPGNARHGDIEAILDSLRHNAQYRSLVVREHTSGRLTILAGNHTVQALTRHGPGPCRWTYRSNDGIPHPCGICRNQPWKPVARCEIVACDDATARRINLIDNRSAELGTVDADALADLLAALDGDYAGTGYTPQDLEAILALPVVETADALANTEPLYRQQYGVIVVCDDETHQRHIYERLTADGLTCKVVTT